MALPPKKPGAPRLGGQPETVPPEQETGKEKLANERLADVLAELEEELEEIKVKYDMYFIGAERMEPARRRDDLKRAIERVRNVFTRNAGLRFRIQTLHARYLSYERLWMRSTREKEAGTYRRDVLKMRRKAAEARSQPAPGDELDSGKGAAARKGAATAAPAEAKTPIPVLTPGITPARPIPPPLPPKAPPLPEKAPPLPPKAPQPHAMSDGELRKLFESYVAAKRSCNEDVSRVTLESLARTVAKQAPQIAAKYQAKKVEFKVSIRDGRAVLSAVPKT